MEGGEVHIPPESDDFIPKTMLEHLLTRKRSWLIQVDFLVERYSSSALEQFWKISASELKEHLLETPSHQQNLYTKLWGLHDLHRIKYNPSATRLADKTPLLSEWPAWLQLVNPKSNFIFLVRNIFDTIASRKKAFNESNDQSLLRYTNSWKSMKKFQRRHPGIVRILHYEDLVISPERKMTELCEALDLHYDSTMIDSSGSPMGDGGLEHHQGLKNKINDSSVGKGKDSFSEIEKAIIVRKVKKLGIPNDLYKD